VPAQRPAGRREPRTEPLSEPPPPCPARRASSASPNSARRAGVGFSAKLHPGSRPRASSRCWCSASFALASGLSALVLERRGERVQPVPFVAQGVGGGVEDAAHIRSRSTRYPGATDIEPEWTRVAVADPTRVSGGSPPAVRPVLWLQQYLRVTLCNCLQTQGDERPSTLSGGSVTEGCVLGQC